MNMNQRDTELKNVPLSRQLIQALYANGYISTAARNCLFERFYPLNRWGFWTYYLLLSLGVGLVLSSIIYFIAFNWEQIAPIQKLYGIQLLIVISLVGVIFRSIESLSGKLLLLSASVLVGGFLAIFGQAYPTGAEEYQLFLVWSLLIFAWTVLSRYDLMWALWFGLTNVALLLWQSSVFISNEWGSCLATVTLVFNVGMLLLREYFVSSKASLVLSARWCRYGILIAVLFAAITLAAKLIFQQNGLSQLVLVGGIIGMLTTLGAICVYRYYWHDITALTFSVITGALCLEMAVFKLLFHALPFNWFSFNGMLVLIVLFTVGLFSAAVKFVQRSSVYIRRCDEA